MAKKGLSDIFKDTESLSYDDFLSVIKNYAAANGLDADKETARFFTLDIEERLRQIGVNSTCPKCGSENIVKRGKRGDVQRFLCKDCGKNFTLFTDTILEKTRYSWAVWVGLLWTTINNISLKDTLNIMEQDYKLKDKITEEGIYLIRMKLLHACAEMPMPVLTGVIQVDETSVRESQKGSKALVSYLPNENRRPRYGRRPSKYGVMGPEFATIVAAVDNRNRCVCKVAGLGRVSKELFFDLFDQHFDTPAYLCSDANKIYEEYCQLRNIPHYERPSDYLSVIQHAGYETPDPKDPNVDKVIAENKIVLRNLYARGAIDKITNRGDIKYDEFYAIKEQNSLGLGRVNELHSDIQLFINKERTNVSTKNLEDYIGFFTYIRNWRYAHGRYPSSRDDAERILIDIVSSKHTLLKSEMLERQRGALNARKPSGQYISILKEQTELARQETQNKYFKFNEEDGVASFDTRQYLYDLPRYKLDTIAKELGLKRFKKWPHITLAMEIMKQPGVREAIYRSYTEDRKNEMSEEDRIALRDMMFRII